MHLRPSDPKTLKKEAGAIMKERRRREPMGALSAGCFFKNPPSGEPAGRLIELAGLKGSRIGGAKISTKHANFIINRGGAKYEDVDYLIQMIQESVHRKFNLVLQEEIKRWVV